MKYTGRRATEKDIDKIKAIKLETVLMSDPKASQKQKDKVINYVNKTIKDRLSTYEILEADGQFLGLVSFYEYKDGYMLDELYIDKKFRHKGYGAIILQRLIAKYHHIYLWVYKTNKIALYLYKKFSFTEIEITETRYLMEHR